jgi:uncharacterized phage infection (PIP) family protein YhgE
MGEITREEVRERLGNIDQIRDIIVGSHLRTYDGRLEKIESELTMLQQEMRDRVEQVKTTCTTEIRAAVENLEKKFKSLSISTQDNQTDLQQQLDRVSKKLSSNLTELDETIDQKTTSLRQDLSQTRDSLQGDISSLRDLILEELERRFSQLKEAKVSRDDIAEALFEMGMRLKGTEFIPTLKEAAEKHQPQDSIPLFETRKSTEHEGT